MRKALLLLILPFFWACSKNSVEIETLDLKRANFFYFTIEIPDSTGRSSSYLSDFKYQTNSPVAEIIVWENGFPVDTISHPEATAADMDQRPAWGNHYRFRARLKDGTVLGGQKSLPPRMAFRVLDSVPPMEDTLKLYGAFKMDHRLGLVVDNLPTGLDSLNLSLLDRVVDFSPDLLVGAFLLEDKTFGAARSFRVASGDTVYLYSTRKFRRDALTLQVVGPDQVRFRDEYHRARQMLNDNSANFLPASYSNIQGGIGLISYYGFYRIPL
jgi:hypothetical protein